MKHLFSTEMNEQKNIKMENFNHQKSKKIRALQEHITKCMTKIEFFVLKNTSFLLNDIIVLQIVLFPFSLALTSCSLFMQSLVVFIEIGPGVHIDVVSCEERNQITHLTK